MKKSEYNDYLKKYDEVKESGKKSYDDSWDDVYRIVNDNAFTLIWSSRSFKLYQIFQETMGYTWKTSIITSDGLKEALENLNKDYDIYNSEIEYYRKNGYFKSEITSNRIKDALNYLESIKGIANVEKIDNIKTILSKTTNSETDYSTYKECEEELDDIVFAKKIVEALLIFIDYIDDNSILVYDMD